MLLIYSLLFMCLLLGLVLNLGHWNALRLLIVHLVLDIGLHLRSGMSLRVHPLLVRRSLVCDRFTSLMDQGEIVLLQERGLTADHVLHLMLLHQVVVELSIA